MNKYVNFYGIFQLAKHAESPKSECTSLVNVIREHSIYTGIILKENFDLLWFFLMHIYTLDIWAGTWGELQIVVPAMND